MVGRASPRILQRDVITYHSPFLKTFRIVPIPSFFLRPQLLEDEEQQSKIMGKRLGYVDGMLFT